MDINIRKGVINIRRITHEEFVDIVKSTNPDIQILGKYTNNYTKVLAYCSKSKYQWYANPKNLMKGKKCPLCANHIVVSGINDIATTHPFLVKYFKNKEDTIKYTYGSKVRTTFMCPVCGQEEKRSIQTVTKNGFHCTQCDKGISFPNRILRNLLSQLPVKNIVYEYSPEWVGKMRYDSYFEYNNKSYIIEMDGGFHYRTGIGGYYTEQELANTNKRDNTKDNLAFEHGMTLIRIDCNRSNPDYIIKNIKSSELSNIIDITNVDWNKCIYFDESKLKIICDCYNLSSTKTAREVSEVTGYDYGSIQKYLALGVKQGLCDYNAEYNKNYSNAVRVIGVNISNGKEIIFNSYTDCVNEIRQMTHKKCQLIPLKSE